MLHMPGTVMGQEMDTVINTVQEEGLLLRSLYGEGTHGAGDFYEVSNRVTLGVTEEQIVESVLEGARKLMEKERSMRTSLYEQHPEEFEERIQRAFQLVSSAGTLSSEEALNFLSQVRLGAVTGVLDGASAEELSRLFLLTLPAHLQTMEGRELDTTVRNERRASYLRTKLATD
jgi:protein arginine kinase